MKTVKVGMSNMKSSAGGLDTLEKKILFNLKEEFNFEYTDNPDYLFVGDQNIDFDYLNKNCVLIFYTNENMHPNFELYDYCIGYNKELSFGDRYCFYLPVFFSIQDFLPKNLKITKLSREEAHRILKEKDLFCDFIYNHDNDNFTRKHYLDLLNSYKSVSVGGRLYNPSRSSKKRNYDYVDKMSLQKRCKFSIVVESCEFSGGLITEKIFHSILSNTIPIYYGEKEISEYVNPRRFIDAKKYSDNELLQLIKKIDNDDELYLDYICQNALIDDEFFIKNQQRLFNFLKNIFNQDPVKALRKPNNEFSTKWHKDKLIKSDILYNAGIFKTTVYLLKLIFKKLKKLARKVLVNRNK